MNALDLYLLGRSLMRLGEEAMRGDDAPTVPTGIRLILIDLAEHPDSSIGEITARTGLPQSHVSQSVGRLRARGAVETASDPNDGRKTLVRLSADLPARASRLGTAPVEALPDELAKALEPVLAHLRAAGKA